VRLLPRPQIADGGDGLQILSVAANILNKQSRTADKEWPTSVGAGRGVTQLIAVKNKFVMKFYERPRAWKDSLKNDLS
jgi:hypothetical protein